MTNIEIKRFWPKVKKTEKCWLWIACITQDGYGQFWCNKKLQYAHRLSFELHKGEIPKGLTIDHLCRVRHCVNPDHLDSVTNKENILRGIAPSAQNAVKTHCVQGHEYTTENTYRHKRGRECRICGKARKDKFRATAVKNVSTFNPT
jgi:hypothetical protein